MKLFLFCLFLCVSLPNAVAQTTFSFAGFVWGDTIDVVDEKLKASGLSGCETGQKAKCKVFAVCSCAFSGADIKSGIASFRDKKLDSVWMSVVDHAATTQALKNRYGPPLPRRNVSHLSVWEQSEETLTSRWKSEAGESLEINADGVLTYKSGAHNKNREAHRRSQSSKF